jgi:glycosyltransferase involved in cell wall biosynthesis
MRILISALRYHHGKALGGSTYFENLLAAVSRGHWPHRVAVCCAAQMADWVQSVAPSLEIIEAPAPRTAWGKVFNESVVLRYVLPQWKPDVAFFPFNIMPRSCAIPSVLMVHDLVRDFYLTHGNALSILQSLPVKAMVDYSIRQATHIVVPTEAIKAEVAASKKYPAANITAIHEAARPNQERLSSGPKDGFLLLATGCHNEHKKPQVCIQALASLLALDAALYERCRLVITGATPKLGKRLTQTAADLQVARHVSVRDRVPQSELARLMADADLLLFPTIYEGFGLGLIEAQASGKVVLASDIPVLREVAGRFAEFFQPCDHRDLAAKIAALLGDETRRSLLALSAAVWGNRWTWDDHARELRRVFESVAGIGAIENPTDMESVCVE